MFLKAHLLKCSRVLRCIETLNVFSSQCKMSFTPTEFSLQCVTPSGRTTCEMIINAKAFETYQLYDVAIQASSPPSSTAATTIQTTLQSRPLQLEYLVNIGELHDQLKSRDDKVTSIMFENGSHCDEVKVSILKYSAPIKQNKNLNNQINVSMTIKHQQQQQQQSKKRIFEDISLSSCEYDKHSTKFLSSDDMIIINKNKSSINNININNNNNSNINNNSINTNCSIIDSILTLHSNGHDLRKNSYFDLPRVINDYDFRVFMDAAELSNIFREVSIVGNMLTIKSNPSSSELIFHSSGELGTIDIRSVTVLESNSRSLVQMNNKNNNNNNIDTNENSDSGIIVSDEFASRFIKFFTKVLQAPLMVWMYVQNSRPLVLMLPIDNNNLIHMNCHIVPQCI